MRINSAGNVGIGTATPAQKLDIRGGDLQVSRGAAGVAADAAINFGSNANNYIFSGNTNNIMAFATNGSERVRINNAGNVGIGTSSPGKTLDLVGQFRASGSAASGYALLEYGTSATATNNWHVGSEGDGTFRWYNGNLGGGTERMRITSAGDVGIGTSSPGARLEASISAASGERAIQGRNTSTAQFSGATMALVGPSTTSTRFTHFNSNVGGTQAEFAIQKGDGSGGFSAGLAGYNYTSDFWYLSTAGSERMRIDSSGNVGIGTSSPGTKLDVAGGILRSTASAAFNPAITVRSDASATNWARLDFQNQNIAGEGFIYLDNAGTFNIRNNIAGQPIRFYSEANERMRITSAGNVGIGTTAPVQRLHVRQDQDGTTAALIQNRNGSGTPISAIQFISGAFDLSDNRYAMISSAGGSNTRLQFWTGQGATPTEKMRITDAGNVGIGETSPGARLHVSGGTVGTTAGNLLNVTIDQGIAGTNAVGVRTNLVRVSNGTDWTTIAMRLQGRVDAIDFGYIDFVSGGAQGLAFGSATSERMRIDSSGNVGIGTSAPSSRLEVNSLVTLSGGESSQLRWLISGKEWRANAAAGGNWYMYDATNNKFPFTIEGNTPNDTLRLKSTGGITSANVADAVGYKGVPQNAQTSTYTLALSDMGKHISITTGGVVIPANSSVAFPIGSTITVYNNSSTAQNISITTDTLRLAGTATSGTRSLAQRGLATCIKVAATEWVVTGNVT
jgi:hypothetical protein